MRRETIAFRLEQNKRKALDQIAAGLDRDRSYILNQAIDTYLDIHQWQVGHIKKGVRAADAGEFASDHEVRAAFAKWRK